MVSTSGAETRETSQQQYNLFKEVLLMLFKKAKKEREQLERDSIIIHSAIRTKVEAGMRAEIQALSLKHHREEFHKELKREA
jgi:hypothetical protein